MGFSAPGAIAQLGERLHGMQEVVGSSPTSSTRWMTRRRPGPEAGRRHSSGRTCVEAPSGAPGRRGPWRRRARSSGGVRRSRVPAGAAWRTAASPDSRRHARITGREPAGLGRQIGGPRVTNTSSLQARPGSPDMSSRAAPRAQVRIEACAGGSCGNAWQPRTARWRQPIPNRWSNSRTVRAAAVCSTPAIPRRAAPSRLCRRSSTITHVSGATPRRSQAIA